MSATLTPDMDLTDNRGPLIIGAVVACSVLSGLTFAGRIVSRKLLKADFLVSDYMVALGLLGAWLLSSLAFLDVNLGLGKHIQVVPTGNVEKLQKTGYVEGICYSIPLSLIKISILLFYRAIFRGRVFDICTYGAGAFVIAWGIAVLLVAIFTCHPINGFWDVMMRPTPVCINYKDYFISNASLNILADVVILCLPMGKIWDLHMSRRSKAAISGMFLMGGFVIVASFLRLKSLLRFDDSDLTRNIVGIRVWSCVEVNVAVVSACLPTMGPVLQRILQSSFLMKIRSTRETVGLRDDKASSAFNRSTRNERDEEAQSLPEHTIDRLSGPGVQHL